MSNGERSPAALIIGLILLAYAWIISGAWVDLPSWLHAGKTINTHVGVAWYAGLVIAIFGLWNMVQPLSRGPSSTTSSGRPWRGSATS